MIDAGSQLRRSDMRLIARAAREGWPISQEVKRDVMARLAEVIEQGSDRDAIAAGKAILAMDKDNNEAREAGVLLEAFPSYDTEVSIEERKKRLLDRIEGVDSDAGNTEPDRSGGAISGSIEHDDGRF